MTGFDSDQAEVLRMLPWLLDTRRRELEQAETAYREAVRDLVLAGYSWADVGRMLGVSRQAARERFGAEVVWWREHMGKRMPWEDYVPEDMSDHLAKAGRLVESGPVEDLR